MDIGPLVAKMREFYAATRRQGRTARPASWPRSTPPARPTDARDRTIDTGLGGPRRSSSPPPTASFSRCWRSTSPTSFCAWPSTSASSGSFPGPACCSSGSIFLAFFVIYRRGQDIDHRHPDPAVAPALAAAIRDRSWRCPSSTLMLVILLAQAPVLLPRQVGRIDLVGIQRYWLRHAVLRVLRAHRCSSMLLIAVARWCGSQLTATAAGRMTDRHPLFSIVPGADRAEDAHRHGDRARGHGRADHGGFSDILWIVPMKVLEARRTVRCSPSPSSCWRAT
jgi:hypothetical protein